MAGTEGEGNPAGGGAAGGGAGAGNAGGGAGAAGSGEATPKFAAWADYLATQDDTIKALYETDVKGLKTALNSERESKKDLEKKVRDLAGKAEAGSDAQKSLTELADKMAEGDRRVAFYEDAHKAGVSNLKLAFTIATSDDLFDRKGNADFDKLKKDYPELFVKPATSTTPPPKGGAGAGAGGNAPAGGNSGGGMNALIRGATGRRT